MFGCFEVIVDGQRLDPLETTRFQRFFAAVLLCDAARQRARLSFDLWPDSTERQARTNLRKLLHDLRRLVPDIGATILTYAALLRRGDVARTRIPSVAIVAGYLFAWAGFSAAATAAHIALRNLGVLGATMALENRIAVSVVLLAAGAYQLLPIKARCLTRCRSLLEFISRHHRDGAVGAVRMGLSHGAYCLGCCGGLMSLLFVGGVMNLFWIAGIAAIVAIEKLSGPGRLAARVTGSALLGLGAMGLCLPD